jgi:hypothetical protein
LEAPDEESTTDDAYEIQENIHNRGIAVWKIGLVDFVSNGDYESNDSSKKIVS